MAGHVGTIARRREALARAALTELGQRGRIDAGTRVIARGGTRRRRMSEIEQSVWYAWCARCDAYHWAPSWARSRADSHIAQETEAKRIGARYSVALREIAPDPDNGKRLRGAIVNGPTRTSHVALRTTGGARTMRPLARRSLAATLTWYGGAGL